MYKIVYHPEVVSKDIPKLSQDWQQKIPHSIESKLITKPEVFGKPLRRSLKNYRKLRVGDYRVIFRIDGKTVIVLVIQHRLVFYSRFQKRSYL